MSSFRLSPKTSFALDLIRWVSAQMVLIGHALNYFNVFPFLKPPAFILMQNVGVVVFFLLSGLLISHSAFSKLDKHDYTFRHFFIDRFSRIYTAFIPCLFLVLVIDLSSIYFFHNDYPYWENFNIKTFVGNLFMMQDFPLFSELSAKAAQKAGLPQDVDITISSFGSARPFWTLAIEWWFYMAFGWIVLSGKSTIKNKWLRYLLYGFLSIVPLYNLINGRGNGLTMMWTIGVVLTLVLRKYDLGNANPIFFLRLAIFLGILGLARAMFSRFRGFEYVEYDVLFATILAMALLSLIFYSQKTEIKVGQPVLKLNKFLADYSFTLYLLHHSILDLLYRTLPGFSSYTKFFLSLVIANVFCALFAWFTEMRYHNVNKKVKELFANRMNKKQLIKQDVYAD